MAEAITAFERTLITDRFDDFQRGDDEALSDLELRSGNFYGYWLHHLYTGPLLGEHVSESRSGQSTRNFAIWAQAITKDDRYDLKVPTLLWLSPDLTHDGVEHPEFCRGNGLHATRSRLSTEQTDNRCFLGALTTKGR